MPLPSSGQISINDINTEVGRASNAANTSLASLENGTYITINAASTSKPDGANPNKISEWLGYDHNAAIVVIDACADAQSDGSYQVNMWAYSNVAVTTGVTVSVQWVGELGTTINANIVILNGNTCATVVGSANNIGEIVSSFTITGINPSSYGSHTYNQGSATTGGCSSC